MLKAAGSLVCWLPLVSPSLAADAIDYLKDIKPLISRRCSACHGSLKQQSSLRLDTAASIRQGGDQGAAIVPGNSGESLLIQAVRGKDGWRMPPKEEGEPLGAEEIARLAAWIDQGAKAPEEAPPPDPKQHWSFLPPKRPPVPVVNGASHPIDAFLAVEHRRLGLKPLAAADKSLQLRRAYLDLIGLPPTRDELHAFLADTSPDAYEKVVDRLLASPRYGERWGRHWMDVWRYSDWAGYGMEIRESQRHIWRWRDWIIESVNADKPYDRMIVEMLAGDEAAPDDPATLRATGFLARNWFKFNRNVWLDNTVEHTAKAFLGLTLNCARCHDHRYDPIAQDEYYRFRAFFEPYQVRTDRVPGVADLNADGLPRVYDADAATPTYLFVRGNEANPDKEHPLSAGVPAVFGAEEMKIEPAPLPAAAYYPALRPFVQEEMLAAARAASDGARKALAQAKQAAAAAAEQLAKLESQSPAASTLDGAKLAQLSADAGVLLAEKSLAAAETNVASLAARIAADNAKYATPPAADAAVLASAAATAEKQAALAAAERNALAAQQALIAAQQAVKEGDDKTKQAATAAETKLAEANKSLEAAKTAAQNPGDSYSPLDQVYPATSTGRRSALARWIANSNNPLTARVAINQIWLRHFGDGLVPTVFDFGLNGKPPTNPALLDWLAVEFMERGWSMKAVHRLIVTSEAYRRQSASAQADGSNAAIDPDNRYLWRFKVRRMEAEAVRDGILAVAGSLDASMGGADIDPSAGETSARRSVYFRHAHEKQMTFLKLFDAPGVTECYRRDESIVPQQALALANSSLSFAQSRVLAGALSQQAGAEPAAETNAAFILAAFEQVLSRRPTDEERAACEKFLAEQAQKFADPGKLTAFTAGPAAAVKPSASPHQRARENLVHVLFNHNDFVTIR
jgi:hypothetical protein